ncbi:hypothetical protein TWF506_004102 [Arthrobotrys conoides]|uniref:Uncharacterized protein n=1 Tax=Arthrobotrys conoides TaxID=74498 RepID=A0AAN8N1H3_9PEZI
MRSSNIVTGLLFLSRFAGSGVHSAPLTTDNHDHVSYYNSTIQENATGVHQYTYYLNATTQGGYTSTLVPQNILNIALPTSSPRANLSSSAVPPSLEENNCTGCTSPPAGSENSEPPTKTIPFENATKTNPDLEEDREYVKKETISPNFFYKEGRARIKCASAKTVYNIEPHENALGYPQKSWPHWKVLYPHPPDGWVEIEHYQLYCGSCRCDENGRIIHRGTGGCGTEGIADRCSVVLGCYCSAELIQPTANVPGATREDYQDAINRIPETIQNDNPHYWWEMHGLAVPRNPWDLMGWPRGQAPRPIDQEPPWINPDTRWMPLPPPPPRRRYGSPSRQLPPRLPRPPPPSPQRKMWKPFKSEIPLSGPDSLPPPEYSSIFWQGYQGPHSYKDEMRKREVSKNDEYNPSTGTDVGDGTEKSLSSASEGGGIKNKALERRDSDGGLSGIGRNVDDGADDGARDGAEDG